MMDAFEPPVDDDDDIDIYAALGLSTPVGNDVETGAATGAYDPLAAFMDDDDEEDEAPVADLFTEHADEAAPAAAPQNVEDLLATLARDLLDEERLVSSLSGGEADLMSLKVERDREAYHLSLIVDMGGQRIKPFATVVATNNTWKPMSPPKGLHAKWKPLYDALCKALSDALVVQSRSTSA